MTLKVQACNHSITLAKINQKTIMDTRCEKQTLCLDGRNINVIYFKGYGYRKACRIMIIFATNLSPLLSSWHCYRLGITNITFFDTYQNSNQVGRILILKTKKLSPREEVEYCDQSPTANLFQRWDSSFTDSRASALRFLSLLFTARIFIPKAITHYLPVCTCIFIQAISRLLVNCVPKVYI